MRFRLYAVLFPDVYCRFCTLGLSLLGLLAVDPPLPTISLALKLIIFSTWILTMRVLLYPFVRHLLAKPRLLLFPPGILRQSHPTLQTANVNANATSDHELRIVMCALLLLQHLLVLASRAILRSRIVRPCHLRPYSNSCPPLPLHLPTRNHLTRAGTQVSYRSLIWTLGSLKTA